MNTLKMYYWLVKPGIVYSNVIAAMAGFFLASANAHTLNLLIFLAVVAGVGLVISSACVLNNYTDRGIDRKMNRTKKRASASRAISSQAMLVYSSVLGLIGFGILFVGTNLLTAALGVLAYLAYIVLYGIAKRRTIHGTLVGSISGGLPPVAGYTAVTGQLDMGALLLFLVLVAWQMPHFYAIAMRRRSDYKAAGIPVLPVVKGMHATKRQVLAYVCMFIIVNILLTLFGYTGYIYAIILVTTGVVWLVKGVKGFRADDDTAWATKMFLFSLLVLFILCIGLAVGGLLP